MNKCLPLLVLITVITSLGFSQVSLQYPNGGEQWQPGSSQQIIWKNLGASYHPTAKISYSTDNGATWIIINSSVPNNGSYMWTVANTPSASCRIKVELNGSNYSDASDASFTITGTSGNNDMDLKERFNLYPLPANEVATIVTGYPVKTIRLYSITGAVVKQYSFDTSFSSTIQIVTEDIPSGTYLVEINGEVILYQKLIVQH